MSTPPKPQYLSILAHYERCLGQHGSGPLAVDWKSAADAAKRYDVMLGLVGDKRRQATLLDFGCGLAALKSHMAETGWEALRYTGLEASSHFAEQARRLHPDTTILCLDVLDAHAVLPPFDYIVMNGIFTRRHDLDVEAMTAYFERLLPLVFASCRIGLAFNVMSKSVDWESPELYHPDPGGLLSFVSGLTRHFVLRNDYGLHETTLYLYRNPRQLELGREDGAHD